MYENGIERTERDDDTVTIPWTLPDDPHAGRHPPRPLTDDQARDIYRRYWAGERLAAIAAAHGVSMGTVYNIGIRWTHRAATEGLAPGYPLGVSRTKIRDGPRRAP